VVFCGLRKNYLINCLFKLKKLLPLVKLHIFLLFKLYFIPTFKFNQEKNCIFETNFLVYAKEKKNITKVEMMMEIYNTYDELLIYLICVSIVLEISFFSYGVKYLMMVTQNYFN
jgi:hypothetical protein